MNRITLVRCSGLVLSLWNTRRFTWYVQMGPHIELGQRSMYVF